MVVLRAVVGFYRGLGLTVAVLGSQAVSDAQRAAQRRGWVRRAVAPPEVDWVD